MSDSPRQKLSLKRDLGPKVEERLHKVLAQAGLGSRRSLEERISQGQVKVNGEVASLGSSVKNGDRIELDGRAFVASAQSEPSRVIIYNKPEGELTTREDPEGRPTVFDNLPTIKGARWVAVGRLDINTTGLLVLTTDGELANALMHPSSEIQRTYVCRIHGEVEDDVVRSLQKGIELEDGPARFDDIERIGASDSHAWFRVGLHEGRNREVRRMWEAVGFQVSRLKRVSYGSVELPRLLRRGHFEELSPERATELRQEVGLGPVAPSLTLQPVIGQRRAKASEYRPAPREQKAWTQGGYADEGREFRAFDSLGRREDAGKGPKRGKRPARGGAAGKGPPRARQDGLTAPAGKPAGRGARSGGGGRRGAAPGYENPQEFRSWYVPDGVDTTSPSSRPKQPGGGRPGAKPAGKPGSRPARPGGGGPQRGPRGGSGNRSGGGGGGGSHGGGGHGGGPGGRGGRGGPRGR